LWGRLYAQWLVKHPDAELTRSHGAGYRRRRPSNAERVDKLSQVLGRRIHPEWVRFLEKRADFAAYFERLRDDPRFLARELSRQRIAESLRTRSAALAEAQRTGDIDAIEKHTRWVVELAFRPQRPRRKQTPPITIQIGTPAPLPTNVVEIEVNDVEHEVVQGPYSD
jgi:hypothetical protein